MVKTTKQPDKRCLTFQITITILTSVQVILVPYSFLFYVLTNAVLNISRGTFFIEDTCTNIKVTETICIPSLKQ